MASKGVKTKENSSKGSSIVPKSSSDSKGKGGSTPPHSTKTTKGKLGALEKQKLDEENNAREQERIRRATPDQFGVSLNDYSELLACPLDQLSEICAKILRYSNSPHNHKNAFLDHLYVRAFRDFREFAANEETLKRLADMFFGLLQVLSKEFLDVFEILEVMGSGYSALIQLPSQIAPNAQLMQDISSFFLETFIMNYNLYRFVLTTSITPIYKLGKVTVRSPNADPFSNTTLCPLVEAIPQKEEKILLTAVTIPGSLLPDGKVAVDGLHGAVTDLLTQASQIAQGSNTSMGKPRGGVTS